MKSMGKSVHARMAARQCRRSWKTPRACDFSPESEVLRCASCGCRRTPTLASTARKKPARRLAELPAKHGGERAGTLVAQRQRDIDDLLAGGQQLQRAQQAGLLA